MSEEHRFTRPLVAITVSYIAGIVLGRFWLQEPFWAYWSVGLLLLLAVGAVFRRDISTFMAVLLLTVLGVGGAAFIFASSPPSGGVLEYAGTPVYIEGTVVDEPLVYGDHAAYRLRVEMVETKEGRFAVPGTLLMKLYGAEREGYWFGERLRLRGTIVEPKGARNPGGFDYRFYLLSRGIDALVYPRPAQVSSLGEGDAGRLASAAVSLRAGMVEGIEANLPSPAAELLIAILFGQRHRLPDDVEENFRRAGAGHIMAVSGLHVGLVAALILGLWRRLGLRGWLPLVLAIALIFAYAFLTGFRPAALRAAVMLSLALGAVLLDREHDLPTGVALAALVTLAYNPMLLFAVSFQLSYAATLAIVCLYRPLYAGLARLRLPAPLRSVTAVTLAAQLGVLPLCAYHFQHIPAGALFFNLLLLPLLAPLVGLGLTGAAAYLASPALAAPLLWACRPLLELMLALTGLARLPGIYRPVSPPGIFALAVIYGLLAGAAALYYRSKGGLPRLTDAGKLPALAKRFSLRVRPAAAIGLVLALAVLLAWGGMFTAPPAALTITFLDVGQGSATLVETPCGVTILVDGGGDPPYRGDPAGVGERILLPYLRGQGIRRLDLVVVSHPHEDHFGGLLTLVEEIPVGLMLVSPVPGESPYYRELLERARAKAIPVEEARSGQLWCCGGGLVLQFLWPPERLLRGTASDLNNNSLVSRLDYGSVSILFTGDIEDAAVRGLLRQKVNLEADILQVPHHGGYLEAMPDFIRAVGPLAAVIPVGTNPFGHPHPYILENLEEAGVAVYRNDLHGAVIIRTDGEEIRIETMLPHCRDFAIAAN